MDLYSSIVSTATSERPEDILSPVLKKEDSYSSCQKREFFLVDEDVVTFALRINASEKEKLLNDTDSSYLSLLHLYLTTD